MHAGGVDRYASMASAIVLSSPTARAIVLQAKLMYLLDHQMDIFICIIYQILEWSLSVRCGSISNQGQRQEPLTTDVTATTALNRTLVLARRRIVTEPAVRESLETGCSRDKDADRRGETTMREIHDRIVHVVEPAELTRLRERDLDRGTDSCLRCP